MQFSDSQNMLLEVSSQTNGNAGYAAKSSIRHVHRALGLKSTMPEVSAFLAITAEEEASTALFSALKNKRYARAKELKKNSHLHKAGVYPFLILLGETIGIGSGELPVEMTFNIPNDSENKILRTRMLIGKSDGMVHYVYPDPPLNLVSVDASGNVKDYLKDIRSVAFEKGIKSIHEYIKTVANIRNQMLYASDSSIPNIKNVDEMLQRHIGATFLIHAMYLFIAQQPKQKLVEECLDIYLKTLSRVES
ncbi:hypothetical protein [Vibrio metschnikovii]|uniref:hypothetical protein n=1 Tax=Vibrio metschnikovii TaxID=28172 RepID=UPI001C30F7B8|nr:hypothetical protein [Vibrio metschnikovii]EKO3892348.1 hypothetical protein [Vibrio metschnikovii]